MHDPGLASTIASREGIVRKEAWLNRFRVFVGNTGRRSKSSENISMEFPDLGANCALRTCKQLGKLRVIKELVILGKKFLAIENVSSINLPCKLILGIF